MNIFKKILKYLIFYNEKSLILPILKRLFDSLKNNFENCPDKWNFYKNNRGDYILENKEIKLYINYKYELYFFLAINNNVYIYESDFSDDFTNWIKNIFLSKKEMLLSIKNAKREIESEIENAKKYDKINLVINELIKQNKT